MPPKFTLISGGLSNPPPEIKSQFEGEADIPAWDDLSPELQGEIFAATAPPETDTIIFKPNLFLVDPSV